MSLIIYNGVTLPYGQTTYFKQDVVYDGVGQTDRSLYRYDIQTVCIVNPAYFRAMAPTLFSSNTVNSAPEIMKLVRDTLTTPRKSLSLSFNGFELMPSRQAGIGGTVDAKNGPIPQSCDITQLSTTSFILVFRIIAHYWEKIDADDININQRGNPILYNRWTEVVDMDECDISTITRSGTFAIRSDNVEGQTADTFRPQMAMLGVRAGFTREKSQYTISPDGLAIQYTLVDKEQYKMPPSPAFRAEGTYTESVGKAAAIRYGTAKVKLYGHNFHGGLGGGGPDLSTDQARLVQVAMGVVFTKLQINGAPLVIGNPKFRGILMSASVSADMYKNIAEATATVMFPTAASRNFSIQALRSRFIYTPGSEPAASPPPYRLRGTAGVLLRAAAYYDPSLVGVTVNPDTGQFTRGAEIGTAGAVREG